MTDEQLSTITGILYSGSISNNEKIRSAKGIEKLTSLTYLDLCNNNLNEIDVSQNTVGYYIRG